MQLTDFALWQKQTLLPHAFFGVFILLVFASTIAAIFKRVKPSKTWIEIAVRIRTWWWIVLTIFLAISIHAWVCFIVFGLIACAAFQEFLSLRPLREADRKMAPWLYLAIVGQFYLIAIDWYNLFVIFLPVYAFLFVSMRMVLIGDTKNFINALGSLHWGLMTTAYSIGHIAYLVQLGNHRPEAFVSGGTLFFFLIFLTQINDVAQFVWGKTVGKHKALPSVSPGKTIEGLLGGALTTTIIAWVIAPYLTPMSPLHAIACGLLIGFMGFIGDVVMSAVKRDIGVKDSSQRLPGHGGLLDRLDSLTFTAPLVFHFYRYFYT